MSQSRGRWDTRLGVSEEAGGCRYGGWAGSDRGDHCGNNGLLGHFGDWKERTNRSLMVEGEGHCREEEVVDNYRRRHNHQRLVAVGDSFVTRSGVGPPPGEGGSIVT